MPEKWSLPGGEYSRIIVKDHLKIKGPRMKMTHRVYGKPMMTKRTIIYPDRLGSKCIMLWRPPKHPSYYLPHLSFNIFQISFLYKSNFADGNA